jgi:hypothetical protein
LRYLQKHLPHLGPGTSTHSLLHHFNLRSVLLLVFSLAPSSAGYTIDLSTIKNIILEKDKNHIKGIGGAPGLAKALQSDIDAGLSGSEIVSSGKHD